MLFKHIKTNKGLWLGIAAGLFLLSLFFSDGGAPVVALGEPGATKASPPPAAQLWEYYHGGNGDFILVTGVCLLWWGLIYGVPALIFAWIIHCVILLILECVKTRK
jgi:hypothetical protein